jgi:hypothetical protein
MKRMAMGMGLGLTVGLAGVVATATAANAAGWASVHRYVKKTGKCGGQEILASYYHTGKRTATGERFDANGNTAAARVRGRERKPLAAPPLRSPSKANWSPNPPARRRCSPSANACFT